MKRSDIAKRRCCLALFSLPLLLVMAAPQVVQAKSEAQPEVAVLDFGVLTPAQSSAILSRITSRATDAVAIEIARTRRYSVISRTRLSQKLHELGLSQPLNNNGMRKIGQALGADLVASGDITEIAYTQNPRRSRVTLSIRLTDVVSGELVNGAIETGYASVPPAGMTPDDETLINQAITDAAFNIMKTINKYSLPEAIVLLTTADGIMLNRGSRDGIQLGQEFIVTRGREPIGKIQVFQVNASTSVGKIIDPGKGIRPKDRAITVFKLPGYGPDCAGCGICGIHTTVPATPVL